MGTDQSEEKLAIILEWGPGRARVVNSLATGLWGTPGNFGAGRGSKGIWAAQHSSYLATHVEGWKYF